MKNINLQLLSCLLLALALPVNATETLSSSSERHSTAKSSSSPKKLAITTQSYQSHVWFNSVDIFISGDINNNGYFHQLEVEFDADTSLPYQQVFAEFSLLPTYGGEKIYYTSSVFELFRQSNNDWLAVDTVLERRFPADEYLLTIRLFDANTGYLLAEISGFDDSNLDYLPLEDYDRDSYITDTTVVVSGGTTGIFSLLVLCLMFYSRVGFKRCQR
ncbi:choice-of-anchor H family protein [Rheinheimera metallidurans]|uniref:choice-of-anchor H family protein n=1 Tax=Rheinheimera metallidurans TaxID=2925781 RepID=UPI003001D457